MDHNSDFSFQKFPTKEEDESPKPMPGAPILPNKDSIGRDSASISVKKDDQPSQLLPYSIVEVLESLTISPASSMSKTQTSQPATVVPLPPPNMLSSQVTATTSNSSRRAKIPLERGFTQVDWMKLTRTHPNLAGLNGGSNQRLIPMEEVRQHKSEENAWTVFRGKVYNITHYLKFHPGGKDKLMQGAGKDCTTLFNKYHAWVNAEFLLEKCLVGHLDVSALNKK